MARDPHDQWRWKKRGGVSDLVRTKNPICQFVNPDTGQQCTHASEVVHHLTDPKVDPTIFFSWSNLVALCKDHHAGGEVGETQGKVYCDTIGPMDSVYKHGFGLPCWHNNFVPRPPVSEQHGLLPIGSTSTSVGDDALNRALAEPL